MTLRIGCSRALSVVPLVAALGAGCTQSEQGAADVDLLRSLHDRVMEAHRTGDVDAWMAIEAEPYLSANNGTVMLPSRAERRAARDAYLRSTTFTTYRDTRPPIVHLSDDGTLGWLVAEVEIAGVRRTTGGEEPIDEVWAWIELYEKRNGEWRLVGNVSNRRF